MIDNGCPWPMQSPQTSPRYVAVEGGNKILHRSLEQPGYPTFMSGQTA